ncbi:MAG: hypothetical protein K2O12_05100, partial [Muribaculaceae bacterium]|nr:hypothetical protein [Muribaculaceae bacterium]
MIKVLTKKEELSEFSPFWEELYSVDKTATPFQKIGYVNACMDFGLGKSESLYVITIKDDPTNKWVAVFPFFLDKKGKLRFINARHTDFCSAVIHPDYSHYSLFKELSEFIIRDSRVTGLELDNMESNNKLISVLKPQFRYTIVHDMNYY